MALCREGATVVAVARGQDGLDSVIAACEAEGGRCDGIPCDATEPEQVRAMVESVVERHGRIDVLHHNLGAPHPTAPPSVPAALPLPPLSCSVDTFDAPSGFRL